MSSRRWAAGALVALASLIGGCGGELATHTPAISASPAVSVAPSLNPIPTASPTPVGGVAVPPGSVVAIDARTGALVKVVPVGDDPLLLVIAGGQVWTLDFVAGSLNRVDPASFDRTVVELDGDAAAIASDGEDVYVAANERFLVRVDGATGTVESTVALADERIFRLRDAGFLAAAGGDVWMTIPMVGRGSAPQTLWRIDATTGAVTERYPLPGDPLTPLVAGGAVWVPALAATALVRVDLAGGKVTTIRLGDLPGFVASGGGSIWVALARRTVVRLSPVDGSVQAEIMVDTPARGIAFGAIACGSRPKADSRRSIRQRTRWSASSVSSNGGATKAGPASPSSMGRCGCRSSELTCDRSLGGDRSGGR